MGRSVPASRVVPFPQHARYVARQAPRMLWLSLCAAERHLGQQLQIQADTMHRRGNQELRVVAGRAGASCWVARMLDRANGLVRDVVIPPSSDERAMTLELFTLEEVAETFRCSPRKMREHVKQFPFYRELGGTKLFTRSDVRALYEALQCPSNSSEDPVVRAGISTGLSEASTFARAQELLTRKPPRRSGPGGSGRSFNVVSLERKRPRRSSQQP